MEHCDIHDYIAPWPNGACLEGRTGIECGLGAMAGELELVRRDRDTSQACDLLVPSSPNVRLLT